MSTETLEITDPSVALDCSEVALHVGDLVQAVPPFALACGSGLYDAAVVVSVDPLVLVSRFGDMRWSATVRREFLKPIGKANLEEVLIAMKRYAADLRNGTL